MILWKRCLSEWGFGIEAPKIERKQKERKIKPLDLEGDVLYQSRVDLVTIHKLAKLYRYDIWLGLVTNT